MNKLSPFDILVLTAALIDIVLILVLLSRC